jgi:hypothetical protein
MLCYLFSRRVVTSRFRETWRYRRLSAGTVGAVAALVASCRGASDVPIGEQSGDVLDSAGVAIVAVGASDRPTPWRVDAGRTLVPTDNAPSLLVEEPRRVGVDWAGNVYILSNQGARVDVFDTTGLKIRALGRAGGAPGEFRYPEHISVSTNGTVSVVDAGRRVVIDFGPGGKLLREQPFPTRGHALGGLRIYGDTVIAGEDEYASGRPTTILRMIVGNDTTELGRLVNPTLAQAEFRCGNGRVIMNRSPRLLDPRLHWAQGSGRIAVSAFANYEIRWFEDGMLIGVARRALPRRQASPSMVEAMYPTGAFVGRRTCRVAAGDLIRQLGVADNLPQVAGLRIAPDGSSWIERFILPGELSKVDVFSRDFHYVGTFSGLSLPVGFFGQGRFLAPVTDSAAGGFVLRAYQLDPPPW